MERKPGTYRGYNRILSRIPLSHNGQRLALFQGRHMKRIYLSPPHLGNLELNFVRGAIASNWITGLGPDLDAFEKECAEVVGMPHAVALSSGTAALHLALRVIGVGHGDE